MTPHLCARDLSCAIGRRVILRDVDIDVADGEVVGIVGANGTGKSTLLRTLAGIRPVAAGEVLVRGERLAAMPARTRAKALALVGQEDDLPADLLAGELVALGRIPHRPPWAGGDATERAGVLAALARVDLEFAADVPVVQLSGGERRRVLLARGLVQEAPLLLLEEPTNHLDVRHQHALMQTVRSLGRTVVTAMHDLDLAAAYCDRIVVLHNGRVLITDVPERALTPEVVAEAFGVVATPVTHPGTGRVHLLFSAPGGSTSSPKFLEAGNGYSMVMNPIAMTIPEPPAEPPLPKPGPDPIPPTPTPTPSPVPLPEPAPTPVPPVPPVPPGPIDPRR